MQIWRIRKIGLLLLTCMIFIEKTGKFRYASSYQILRTHPIYLIFIHVSHYSIDASRKEKLRFYFFICLLLHARYKLLPVIIPHPKPAGWSTNSRQKNYTKDYLKYRHTAISDHQPHRLDIFQTLLAHKINTRPFQVICRNNISQSYCIQVEVGWRRVGN